MSVPATIPWIQFSEDVVAENMPDGTPDVDNRPLKFIVTQSDILETDAFPGFMVRNTGTGNPETIVNGATGHAFIDSVNQLLYIKMTPSGNTGWKAIGGNLFGNGSPEGVVTAAVGQLYEQRDATSYPLWVKKTGTGNTGWRSLAGFTGAGAGSIRITMDAVGGGGTGTQNTLVGNSMTITGNPNNVVAVGYGLTIQSGGSLVVGVNAGYTGSSGGGMVIGITSVSQQTSSISTMIVGNGVTISDAQAGGTTTIVGINSSAVGAGAGSHRIFGPDNSILNSGASFDIFGNGNVGNTGMTRFILIGRFNGAIAGTVSGSSNIFIGDNISSTVAGGAGFNQNVIIAFGLSLDTKLTNNANNFIVGGNSLTINRVIFGAGDIALAAAGPAVELRTTDGNGVDRASGHLTIRPGSSTGAGAPSEIIFKTAPVLGSGSTVQTASEVFRVFATGVKVTGTITLNTIAYTWPAVQVASGFLQTNGAGALSWVAAGASVTGTGTTNQFPKWTSSSTIGDSLASEITGVTVGVGVSQAVWTFAAGALTEAASGNHTYLAGMEVRPPVITAGAATVTNAMTLYISAAPSATVSGALWAIFVNAGDIKINSGNLSVSGNGAFGGTISTTSSGVSNVDGSAATPAYRFTSESIGFYRSGSNTWNVVARSGESGWDFNSPGAGVCVFRAGQNSNTDAQPHICNGTISNTGIFLANTVANGIRIHIASTQFFRWNSSGMDTNSGFNINAGVGAIGRMFNFSGTITEAGSGTHARLSLMELQAPTITAGAAVVTDASTLFISGAPAAAGANNWAILSNGDTRFTGGILEARTLSGVVARFTNSGANNTEVVWRSSDVDKYSWYFDNTTATFRLFSYIGSADRVIVGLGIQVGNPTGGDKGTGTINVATDVFKAGTAYTNPDYVFEKFYTGRIVKFVKSPGAARYTELMPLEKLESFTRKHHHLPRISKASGIFERGDMVLEKVEELHLYIFQLNKRIKELEVMAGVN